MSKIWMTVCLIALLSTPAIAETNCRNLLKENLQLKQKLIELQGTLLQQQYDQITTELKNIQASEEKSKEESNEKKD